MFRTPLCPSSGAHDDSVGYHIGRLVLELLLDGSLTAEPEGLCANQRCRRELLTQPSVRQQPSYLNLSFHPAATREPDGLCGNKRYRRELLTMDIMVPETWLSLTQA